MKTLATAIVMGAVATAATAQVNYQMQVACNPQDVKTYDTERLRASFLMEKVMAPDEINLTYSMYDRFIYGGATGHHRPAEGRLLPGAPRAGRHQHRRPGRGDGGRPGV